MIKILLSLFGLSAAATIVSVVATTVVATGGHHQTANLVFYPSAALMIATAVCIWALPDRFLR